MKKKTEHPADWLPKEGVTIPASNPKETVTLSTIDKQIKRWADQLQEARSAFAIGLAPGEGYRVLDMVIEEMKQYQDHDEK